MYPRRMILHANSFSHVFFRCHNRQMFLKNDEMKQFLLLLWAKYCKRYHIKLYDFIILDNHAHFLVQARSAEDLGNFMRTVNSQLATMINKVFDRDSQAIKERYKSPLITNNSYLIKVMQYIWLNRYKVNKSRPDKDPYCSASWRLDPQAINRITRTPKIPRRIAIISMYYSSSGI